MTINPKLFPELSMDFSTQFFWVRVIRGLVREGALVLVLVAVEHERAREKIDEPTCGRIVVGRRRDQHLHRLLQSDAVGRPIRPPGCASPPASFSSPQVRRQGEALQNRGLGSKERRA